MPAHSFILRVWLERSDGEPGEWRGELKHVPSGETAFFRTLDGLQPLLERLLAAGGTARGETTLTG
ncbi:MAG TPA: hypothetical protein VNP72_07200, partial [Longimicrobium sp.]|nr:hypothetical protein [Longimicrobium sp.]